MKTFISFHFIQFGISFIQMQPTFLFYDTNKQKIRDILTNLIYYGRKLKIFGVPVGIVVKYCGVTDVGGSPNLTKKLEDMIEDLEEAAEKDVEVYSDELRKEEVDIKEWAGQYIDEKFNDNQLPTLPNSLKK